MCVCMCVCCVCMSGVRAGMHEVMYVCCVYGWCESRPA